MRERRSGSASLVSLDEAAMKKLDFSELCCYVSRRTPESRFRRRGEVIGGNDFPFPRGDYRM